MVSNKEKNQQSCWIKSDAWKNTEIYIYLTCVMWSIISYRETASGGMKLFMTSKSLLPLHKIQKKKNEILVLLKFWNIRGKSMFLISWSLRALSSSLPLVASKLPGLLYQTLTSHSDKEKNITFSAYIIDYILFQPNVKYKCTHMKSYTCWVLELHSTYLTAPIIFLSSSPCYSNSSYYYSQSYDFL